MPTKMFRVLATLEALFALPLAYFLPSSNLALVLTGGILFGLNASVVVANSRGWLISLNMLNMAAFGIGLGLVLGPSIALSMSAVTIGVLCLLLVLLGWLQLPDQISKSSLTVQTAALAITLVAWMTVQKYGLVSGEEKSATDHMQMGLRFLFGAPLLLVAVTNFAAQLRGSRYLVLLIAVCAGQLGIGFFELGGALQMLPLIIAGFAFVGFFLLLVVFAVAFYRPKRA